MIPNPDLTTLHNRTLGNARRPARGFTLLEVLIALGILSVLLTMIWSMMEHFQELEEKGQRQTERSRVLRSLQETLHSDLLHASVFRPPAAPSPRDNPFATRSSRSATSSFDPNRIETFSFSALQGDHRSFQLSILVGPNPVSVLDSMLQPGDASVWLPHQSLEPMRARVFYSFEEESSYDSLEPTYRLKRLVVRLPDRLQQAMKPPVDPNSDSARNAAEAAERSVVILDTSFGMWETVWEHLMHPRIRYHDGNEWLPSWAAGQTPAALEVSFDYESNLHRREREDAEWEASQQNNFQSSQSPTSSPLEDPAESDLDDSPLRDVRLIVSGRSP